ncbi:hypothetical protein N7520_011624 [Penicillium odoratum]|uniref:uncharacterized protein n=1 Tax=Penicillium odoratum TaxID=1167516 RepID=UPI0025489B87|nr:uncharacterized protein N7520_011624 [Penicillium odoratum]KAJ5746442.1 hypothetical protein N7520_011624 [Penicillium odoratum]
MGQSRSWSRSLILFALFQRGLGGIINKIPPKTPAASTSLTTLTSIVSETVTSTITSIIPVTTTQATCTPGTALTVLNPVNTVWFSKNYYWQEQTSSVSLAGTEYVIYPAGGPELCAIECNVMRDCVGINYNGLVHVCTMLNTVTATFAVSSTSFAVIEKFTTNPCLTTQVESSTQLSTATTVVEYTTTVISTVTISTSSASSYAVATSTVPSSTATTPTASTCVVSAIPTSTTCVDGYYRDDSYYYQVICEDTDSGYAGFAIPNSPQDDIWACIQVCTEYADLCVGTFWYEGMCYSPSSYLNYHYDYDPNDPYDNVIQYIAMRLDGNPCSASSTSAVPTSSAIASSAAAASTPSLTSTKVVSSFTIVTPSSVAVASSASLLQSSSAPLTRSSPSPTPSRSVPSSSISFSTVAVSVPEHSSSVPASVHSASVRVSSIPMHSSSVHSSSVPASAPASSAPESSAPVSSSPAQSSTSTTDTIAFETGQTSMQTTAPAPSQFTTSTVFSTEVYTVTACPPSVTDCPASAKTTYYTTKTVAAYTTICPITAAESETGAAPTSLIGTTGHPESFTTSTIYTTQVYPTEVCPSSMKNCAESQKTTSLVTDIVTVYTTICPITADKSEIGAAPTSLIKPTGQPESFTTSTVYTTQLYPTTVCPSSIANCAKSQKITSVATETVVAYVTVCPVSDAETASAAFTEALSPGQESTATLTTVTYITKPITMTTDYKTVHGTSTFETTATYLSSMIIPVTTTVVVVDTETISASKETPNSQTSGSGAGAESYYSSVTIPSTTAASSSAFVYSATGAVQNGSSATFSSSSGTSATTSLYTGSASKTTI